MPPSQGSYQTPTSVHACFNAGGGLACLEQGNHGDFANIGIVIGPVAVTVFGRTSDSELGTFNTQMTQLDLSGSVVSGPATGLPMMVRVDPGTPTTGQTTVASDGAGLLAFGLHKKRK